jgi:hypothetical protein
MMSTTKWQTNRIAFIRYVIDKDFMHREWIYYQMNEQISPLASYL